MERDKKEANVKLTLIITEATLSRERKGSLNSDEKISIGAKRM